ncbi:MAG TPA: type II toxin-antitoxin system HicA family toxin [Planctomycetaceae bacterium]
MRRRDLLRHLERNGCGFDREGANDTIDRNPANGRCAPVPRHREIKETVARAIRDQLGIARP